MKVPRMTAERDFAAVRLVDLNDRFKAAAPKVSELVEPSSQVAPRRVQGPFNPVGPCRIQEMLELVAGCPVHRPLRSQSGCISKRTRPTGIPIRVTIASLITLPSGSK